MVGVLDNAFQRIAEGLADLTPPDEPSRRYERARTLQALDGVSGHRLFWFEIPSGGEMAAFGSQVSLQDKAVRLRVRLSTVGQDLETLPGWVDAHGAQILNRCNRLGPNLGTGIRSIRAPRYDIELDAETDPETGEVIPSGDLDIIVSLRVRAEESDG